MAESGLPDDWEAMSHAARVRRAVEVGRQSLTDPAAAAMLRAWRTGGFTQRLLAAYAGHGSRDSAVLLELTADPSRTVSRIALSVLCHAGDDDSLLAALRALPPRRVAGTLVRIVRERRSVVDRFIDERSAEGDAAVWPLLPIASAALLDRHFAAAAERGGNAFWRRLAVFHPARAAAEIIARLDAATSPDGLLFRFARTVIDVLAKHQPDSALAVVGSLRRHVPLSSISLQALVTSRPVAVADLVLGSTDAVAADFGRVVHKIGAARVVGLFRRNAGSFAVPGTWLARLTGAEREAVYRDLGPAWTTDDGVVPSDILRRLPAPLRQAEARRMIALPALAPGRSSGCRTSACCRGTMRATRPRLGCRTRRPRTVRRRSSLSARRRGSTARA